MMTIILCAALFVTLCAYDTIVAEAVAARDLSAQSTGEAERSYFRRNARDLAARAREIAQAFKPEQAAA